jgi:UDP-galactopyranose mutase
MKYDYLIVGAGLFGAVFAQRMTEAGRKCLVIERRPQIGGNVYTEDVGGIHVHKYGAHIFHTSDEEVWNYVRRFADFNGFINSPIANYRGSF